MHGAEAVGVQRHRVSRRLTGGLQVDGLSADHAVRRPPPRRRPRARAASAATIAGSSVGGFAREQRERFGVQPVAGENRDAVAVHDVQRRTSAAQRVVVHRRQVVVDQRVGVDQLDGARGGQGADPPGRNAASRRDGSDGATASAAASVSTGRRRLPPAKTL